MALVTAFFSALSRRLGQLLRALFGWSVTGLFGQLSSTRQTALSVALVLSLMWPLLVVGVFVPSVAAWAVAFLPLQEWLGDTVLRIVWLVLALVVPVIVGLITAWVAPPQAKQHGFGKTALGAVPLTLGFAISFLVTLFIVPTLKVVALVRRWTDEHVFVQVRPEGYKRVLAALAHACEVAGYAGEVRPVPAVMLLPTRVLKFFARGGLDAIVADDPHMVANPHVQAYLYPGDVLLRGEKAATARVRTAMVTAMFGAPAHLVANEEAQQLEDGLTRVRATLAEDLARRTGDPAVGVHDPAVWSELRALGRKVEKAAVPFEDWVLLHTNLVDLERAASGGPRVLETETTMTTAAAGSAPHPQPREVSIMSEIDPRPDVPTGKLLTDALADMRELLKAEVALARAEVKREVTEARHAAIALGVAALTAILGLAMLLVALSLAIDIGAVPALVIGLVMLAVAGVAGFLGYRALPKKPMDETRERVETDVNVLKEQVA